MTEEITLREHIEKIIEGDRRANDQRFLSQEKAIITAEHARDVAIKKAEDSIEKKSDAVYVKFTGLQETLTKVMFRPEIESRLQGLSEKIDDLKSSRDTGEGKGKGLTQGWSILIAAVGLIATVIGINAYFAR